MKNIIKCLAVAGMGCLMLPSCNNNDYLDVPQYEILSMDAEFESDDNAFLGLNGIYAYNNVSQEDNCWGIKPNIFTGTHPTMDTQCTGWDVKFLDQTWDANVGELYDGWFHCYTAISRANLFLAGLETADAISEGAKVELTAEARALRGYYYTWLAETFGRVPMLNTGEDYSNTPVKAAAETYEEMWDFIIDDFKNAAADLPWTPYNDEYGRVTKGMAKAYLAEAYMWKAYRCPKVASECYKLAKAQLKEVLDRCDLDGGNSTTYALSTNFATLWDPKSFWGKECIWAMCQDEGQQWSSWGSDRTVTFCNPNMNKWMCACPENGGWGTEYLSWEWYAAYEHGDKRRDASCCTGAVDKKKMQLQGIEPSDVVWGFNPYLQDSLGNKTDDGQVAHATTKTEQFHFTNGEFAPALWTTKFWRNAAADGNSWGTQMWEPTIFYYKRVPNIMLDYAECLFREDANSAEAWALLDKLRNRAWGNLEVGEDYSNYLPDINEVLKANGKPEIYEYPIPQNTAVVSFQSAKTYYTALQKKANRVGYKHTSPAWLVAVNEERRKEFSSEWCLLPDMVRSGYIADHIDYNYPKDNTTKDETHYAMYPWTHRTYTFNINKMDMPIPAKELIKNTALKQNEGY